MSSKGSRTITPTRERARREEFLQLTLRPPSRPRQRPTVTDVLRAGVERARSELERVTQQATASVPYRPFVPQQRAPTNPRTQPAWFRQRVQPVNARMTMGGDLVQQAMQQQAEKEERANSRQQQAPTTGFRTVPRFDRSRLTQTPPNAATSSNAHTSDTSVHESREEQAMPPDLAYDTTPPIDEFDPGPMPPQTTNGSSAPRGRWFSDMSNAVRNIRMPSVSVPRFTRASASNPVEQEMQVITPQQVAQDPPRQQNAVDAPATTSGISPSVQLEYYPSPWGQSSQSYETQPPVRPSSLADVTHAAPVQRHPWEPEQHYPTDEQVVTQHFPPLQRRLSADFVTREQFEQYQNDTIRNTEDMVDTTRRGMQDLQRSNQDMISDAVNGLVGQVDARLDRQGAELNARLDRGLSDIRSDLQEALPRHMSQTNERVMNLEMAQGSQRARIEAMEDMTQRNMQDLFGMISGLQDTMQQQQQMQQGALQDITGRLGRMEASMDRMQTDLEDAIFHDAASETSSATMDKQERPVTPDSVKLRYGDPPSDDDDNSSGGGGDPPDPDGWGDFYSQPPRSPQSLHNRSSMLSQPFQLTNLPLMAVRMLPPEAERGPVVAQPHLLKTTRKVRTKRPSTRNGKKKRPTRKHMLRAIAGRK